MSENLFDLTGRVAIVTGASRGLGSTLPERWRAPGGPGDHERRVESLGPFQAEIAALGRRALPLELDVRNPDSIRRMAEAAAAHYGRMTSSSTTPAAMSADLRWR